MTAVERRPAGAREQVVRAAGDRAYDVPSDELVVHLAAGHGTAGLLKVLSVLHSRRVLVHRLQYETTPDGPAPAHHAHLDSHPQVVGPGAR